MHLHEAIERRTGRFQQQSQISENDVRLAGKRTMPPLSCFGVDCQHAGAKDEAAGTDSRRLVMSVMLAKVESGPRGRNSFAQSHRTRSSQGCHQSDTCATPRRRNRSMSPRALRSPRLTRASSKAFILLCEIFPLRSKKLFLRKKS